MSVIRMDTKTKRSQLVAFLTESNLIEGIRRDPTEAEIVQTMSFLELGTLRVFELQELAQTYQQEALLRSSHGMDVRVGKHLPPRGGPQIERLLSKLLIAAMDGQASPYDVHCEYEDLHPFMDGNGRTGRALWAWMMIRRKGWESTFALPFLHRWYYQSLDRLRDSAWAP